MENFRLDNCDMVLKSVTLGKLCFQAGFGGFLDMVCKMLTGFGEFPIMKVYEEMDSFVPAAGRMHKEGYY